MEELISINEAEEKGIERLRLPIWDMKEDHIKLDFINGKIGPWTHLYSPFNKYCNGKDPVNIVIIEWGDLDIKQFLPYEGPLPDSKEYKEKEEFFGKIP